MTRSHAPCRGALLVLALSSVAANADDWNCHQDEYGERVCPNATVPLYLAANGTSPSAPPSSTATHTGPDTTVCGTPARAHPAGTATAGLDPGQTRIRADRLWGTEDRFVLRGDVVIRRDHERMRADRVVYDKSGNRIQAQGNVVYHRPGLEIQGQSGYTQIEGERGAFDLTHYELTQYNARGNADRVERLSATLNRLANATYSTCPDERKDWELIARHVELDQGRGVGTARGVTVEAKGVPVLYTPYISFPIDDRRKSGFLLPSLGRSDETGADVSIPYYWNIAPNRDATLTARYMNKRGLQLQGEYRYLHRRSRGQLGFEYIPDDDVFGDARSLVTYEHHSRFDAWRLNADISSVSDDRYFEELGNSLSLASLTHLERRIDARYDQEQWSALIRAQDFQAVGDIVDSYRRLPQLVSRATIPGGRLTYHWYAELVNFDHRDDVPTGTRLDLKPGISLEYRRPAGYLRPTLSIRHTQYALTQPDPTQPEHPDRTLPIGSLDSGLFFERQTALGRRAYTQTLEPRLFYLYVPGEEQDTIPRFDTGELDFSFAQMFRDNRFSGADRQGDANQLTVALTTRYLDQHSGREHLRASIGQIYYFRDRKVTLQPGDAPGTQDSSAVVGEVSAALWAHNRVTAGLHYDLHDEQIDRAVLRYHYQSDNEHILNAAYRLRRDDLEQADVSVFWPLGRRWKALARWNYSLRDDRVLEAFGGLEYDTCCWAVRLVARQHVNTVDGGENRAFYVQVVLKGLGRLGEDIDTLMERGILGYRADTVVQ